MLAARAAKPKERTTCMANPAVSASSTKYHGHSNSKQLTVLSSAPVFSKKIPGVDKVSKKAIEANVKKPLKNNVQQPISKGMKEFQKMLKRYKR
jgi:hypothetical protein